MRHAGHSERRAPVALLRESQASSVRGTRLSDDDNEPGFRNPSSRHFVPINGETCPDSVEDNVYVTSLPATVPSSRPPEAEKPPQESGGGALPNFLFLGS